MLTLYTAIGTLKPAHNKDKKNYAAVINYGQEYGLSEHEFVLWSCLAFQILNIHELADTYISKHQTNKCPEGMPLSHYLNRLLIRGLIAKGDGRTGMDAVYQLIRNLHLTPVDNSFHIRLCSGMRLFLSGQISLHDFSELMKSPSKTPMEEHILTQISKCSLTTIELITCLHYGIQITDEQDILKRIHLDSQLKRSSPVTDELLEPSQYPIIQAIGDLYLKKQICFCSY